MMPPVRKAWTREEKMKIRITLAALFFVLPLLCSPVQGESILGGMEELGHALNEANAYILHKIDPPTYAEMMRRYRQLEYERVLEFSAVSGVAPEVIRQMRKNGDTWQEIGDRYDINVNTLPQPVLPSNFGASY